MNYGETNTEEIYSPTGGPAGSEEEDFVRFFEAVADKIIADLHPRTVLDVGCGAGYLVTALRHRGVEAYGIDISGFAMDQMPKDVRVFCNVQTALAPLPNKFPKKYDLLISLELMEYLTEKDGLKLMKLMSSYSDNMLFSSSPDGSTEPAHINIQRQEYWCKHFAEQDVFHNLSYDASYVAPHALLFTKGDKTKIELVESYEYSLRTVSKQQEVQSFAASDREPLSEDVEELQRELQISKFTIDKLNLTISRLQHQTISLTAHRNHLQNLYDQIAWSTWWRITKPGRVVLTGVKSALHKVPVFNKMLDGLKLFKKLGVSGVKNKIVFKRKLRRYIPKNSLEMSQFVPSQTAVEQIETKFPKEIKFSILVPLYNTPEVFLKEMIDSCLNQTYRNWELCLADASDNDQGRVAAACAEYAKRDPRIRYKKLDENKGISINTNAAIEMATGDYISLLDHDDLLHPSALFENMKAITEHGADFMYTDELTFASDIYDVTVIHLKPDFAIDNLRSNNYICHFSTFSRQLLDEAGWFNPECDGSQDYDIILRLTEKARKIYHIRKIMYYWRNHAGSVASDVSAKPYCITAAKKALAEHLNRVGMEGEVSLIDKMPSFYRIKYKLKATPLVSIIIPTKDHIDDLENCLKSVLEKTTYPNYEIIVVENNSTKPSTFRYYESLKEFERIKVVTWQHEFNYSAINNFGLSYAKGEYILLLNNDVEIITPEWIEEMLMFAQREDVGAVGAKLYYPDDTVQHAGLGIGLLTLAGHLHRGFDRNNPGYMGRLIYSQNLSGVTAACMMLRRSVYEEIGGFNEKLQVAFNDVDLCLKIRKAGYLIAFTPYAELYHYESKSRGDDMSPEHYQRFSSEVHYFQDQWSDILENGDPYLNPNFDYNREDFRIDVKPYV